MPTENPTTPLDEQSEYNALFTTKLVDLELRMVGWEEKTDRALIELRDRGAHWDQQAAAQLEACRRVARTIAEEAAVAFRQEAEAGVASCAVRLTQIKKDASAALAASQAELRRVEQSADALLAALELRARRLLRVCWIALAAAAILAVTLLILNGGRAL